MNYRDYPMYKLNSRVSVISRCSRGDSLDVSGKGRVHQSLPDRVKTSRKDDVRSVAPKKGSPSLPPRLDESRLTETPPIRDGEQIWEKITYTRIRPDLNFLTMRQIAKKHTPKAVVEDMEGYLSFTYPEKPTVYVSKKDGRIYGFGINRDICYQAYMVLRLLVKYGYVVDYRREQHHHYWNIGF